MKVTDFITQLADGVISNSPMETMALAEQLAPILPADTTLCLQGPIGSGKTCFTAALAHCLGVEEAVTSPSYNLLSIYKAGERTILHLDAYRLDAQTSEDALSLEDLMETPWLLVVEWPENISGLLTPNKWCLTFEIAGENDRLIRLQISGIPEID